MQGGAKFRGSIQVATQIGADSQVGFGRNGKLKVGIKTGDAVDLVKGSLRSQRKRFELRFWQKAMTSLNSAKVVEDQGARLKVLTPRCRQKPGAK